MFKKLYKFINQTKSHYSNINVYDTIYALSSGYGKCGVAVIRVSGKHSSSALIQLGKFNSLPSPRLALLRRLRNPQTGQILDRGVVIWFPGPNSFTGEDSCEFQVHGGVAVISAILSALKTIPGLRPAEPGEFTKRAFYNGKMDLTEVEGLNDLLKAETEFQRQQALLQTEGVYSKLYKNWKEVIAKSVAHLEAYLNFDETEALDDDLLNQIVSEISDLNETMSRHLENNRSGERLRIGVYTAIVGEPNVGKSRRPAAIVTSIAGTTRDILESTLDIGGYPMILADTAGLRSHTSDIVEKEGIRRALEYIKHSDLVVLLIDSTKLTAWLKSTGRDFFDYIKSYIETLDLNDIFAGLSENGISVESSTDTKSLVIVINKIDLLDNEDRQLVDEISAKYRSVVSVSCMDNRGLSDAVEVLTRKLKVLCGTPSSENPLVSHARHRHHLDACSEHLKDFVEYTSSRSSDLVLAAHCLHLALNSLGKITGHVSSEQLLDIIFRDFCIGK